MDLVDSERNSNTPSSESAKIKSYGRRNGRITKGQKKTYRAFLSKHTLPCSSNQPWPPFFDRYNEIIVEIGFGDGALLADLAASSPTTGYLGIEVYRPGIAALLRKIIDRNLKNIRIIEQDAIQAVSHRLPRDFAAGFLILFPDPWPKRRHHKRRLIQNRFVRCVTDCLKPDGYLYCATDWQPYSEQIKRVLGSETRLKPAPPSDWPQPAKRELTKYEARGLNQNLPINDILVRKIASQDKTWPCQHNDNSP